MIRIPAAGIVYLATCTVTGKSYVGCSSKGLSVRRDQHVTAAFNGSAYRFHLAIRQYGSASFTWRILENVPATADMYAAEKRWILKLNTYKTGLNSTPGGVGSASDGQRSRARYSQLPARKSFKPMLMLRRR